LFGNRWLPQKTVCALRFSGGLLPQSPPAEKATARQDQAGQSRTCSWARLAKPQGFAALKRLDEEARARGYRAATGPSAEFGLRYRVRSRVPIRPPEGEEGAPVQDVHFELSLRALEKPDSEDQAAIATAMVTAGQHSEEQDIFLEARGGNFARAREFKLEGDRR
jgi:hypothetical protein